MKKFAAARVRYGSIGLAVVVLGLSSSVAQAQSSNWTARPPIHVLPQFSSMVSGQPKGYSPAQIRHAYGFDTLSQDGRGQVIGIVDAYDAPKVAADLKTFSQTFKIPVMNGLPGQPSCTISAGPHPCFQVAYSSKKPASNAGWEQETSLDVEWAHAIAPGADMLLAEASSASLSSLLSAVDVANKKGADVVSMSWGGNEFANQSSYDSHFKKSKVTFFAASGDSGTSASWPSSSRYVVSVGGTHLPLDSQGNRTSTESAWNGSGGGVSAYTKQPTFQSSFGISSSKKRATPDVSYNADPQTGYLVYDSAAYSGQSGWMTIGGTSAAAPQWAALTTLINQSRSKPVTSDSLSKSPFYTSASNAAASYYHDITRGNNGTCQAICHATTGYDFVTGLGSPVANKLVSYLQSH